MSSDPTRHRHPDLRPKLVEAVSALTQIDDRVDWAGPDQLRLKIVARRHEVEMVTIDVDWQDLEQGYDGLLRAARVGWTSGTDAVRIARLLSAHLDEALVMLPSGPARARLGREFAFRSIGK